MDDLKSKLEKVRSSFQARLILKEEFEKRSYPKTREGAEKFQQDLEKEIPSVNKWVKGWNKETGREIKDTIMDEFKIP